MASDKHLAQVPDDLTPQERIMIAKMNHDLRPGFKPPLNTTVLFSGPPPPITADAKSMKSMPIPDGTAVTTSLNSSSGTFSPTVVTQTPALTFDGAQKDHLVSTPVKTDVVLDTVP